MREEVEGLEDEAEPAAHRDRLDRGVGDHLAVEEDVAVVDLLEQVDAPQQRRLAGSRGADQGNRLVLADRQIDPAQDLALAERLRHLADLEDRRLGGVHRTPPLWPPSRSTRRASGTVITRKRSAAAISGV